MGFLNKRTSWSNGELALLKISVVSAGIAAGILLHDALRDYALYFFLLYAVTGIAVFVIWMRR